MKERPILFSTEMVEAILDGNKTQTRRIVKQLENETNSNTSYRLANIIDRISLESVLQIVEAHKPDEWHSKYPNPNPIICKYGKEDDVLWVRETWTTGRHGTDGTEYLYKAGNDDYFQPKWKPSIYMPIEACRIRLKIKSIRVERLTDISEQDAIAEGVKKDLLGYVDYMSRDDDYWSLDARHSYFSLWDKINGKDSHKKNPYVWVIKFERLI